ncbi:alpha/beta hydrolase [Psychrobacter sp. P11G5]|uniref:alpha/beta hydrolase n=1 Tax=Psychrobacter sp. P11G5 TaxID=1699624 RepID=UPI0008299D87|nr:alpha/beta hydrolase [Psychrobacter sp. P11G5]
MSNSIKYNKADAENQVDLLPAVANYLKVLNEQLLPAFINTGSIPNAINARDGLANLTHTFVTEAVNVALIVDDIIECDASTNDAYDVPTYHVPVRLFYPSLPDASIKQTEQTPPPVMLYFHGGGGTAGSVSVYHQILCRLAKHTGHIIVAPEYRLAPENPYPCAQNDACTALLGLNKLLARHHISTNELVIAGDSHGGALVTNLLRDPRIIESGIINDISAQVLIYPSVDFTMSCPSIEKYANGYLLSQARISWYFDQYFQHNFQHDEDRQAKSALFASSDELAHQPPALIINAAIDPLYDEGVAYAAKLSEAGVETQHITYDKVIHAYLNMENLNPDICKQTYQAISEFLGSKSSE